jgi:hypothetical protein
MTLECSPRWMGHQEHGASGGLGKAGGPRTDECRHLLAGIHEKEIDRLS